MVPPSGLGRDDVLVTANVEDSSRGLGSAVWADIECAVVDNAFTSGQNFSQATSRIETLSQLKDLIFTEDSV